MKKNTVLGVILFAFLGFSVVGCFGPFQLTKKLHSWNKGVDGNKWVQEGVFLVMVIVPVYSFSVLADAIVFNSVEFWTGKNPIALAPGTSERVLASGNLKAVLNYAGNRNQLDIRTYRDGQPLRGLRIEPSVQGGMVARNESGKVIMVSQATSDGGMLLQDSKGATVARYSPEEVRRILDQRD